MSHATEEEMKNAETRQDLYDIVGIQERHMEELAVDLMLAKC